MGKKGYHHGNLRRALLDTTLQLLEEKGPQGFTMSEAAKAAGVSPGAPYRHFAGKDAMIAEAAREGFEIFADLLEYAYQKGKPSPIAAFEATGQAYLAFARKHPGHYIAMFESGLRMQDSPELARAAIRAREIMERAAERLLDQVPTPQRPPASMVQKHVWAMSHGIVELFARGEPGANAPFSPEDLLESGMGIYLRGLGVLPVDSGQPN